MKKVIFIIGLIVIANVSFGQLGVGIKGAVTMSTLSPDVSDWEQAAKTGFQFGGFVRIGDKWHLQPEAYFTSKGGGLNVSFTDPDPQSSQTIYAEQTFSMNSVDIPVLVGYKLIDPPTLNVRLQAGPVVSFVTDKEYKVTFDGVEPPEDENLIDLNSLKDVNWGLQLGAGVDFLFLTLDVRYELGISNMLDNTDVANVSVSEFRNNVFFVSLGWKIL